MKQLSFLPAGAQESTARMKLGLGDSIGRVTVQVRQRLFAVQAPELDDAVEARAHHIDHLRIETQRRLRMKHHRRHVSCMTLTILNFNKKETSTILVKLLFLIAISTCVSFYKLTIGYGPQFAKAAPKFDSMIFTPRSTIVCDAIK